ncbi:MAG: hypothetical protein ACXVGG_13245 [Mycobacteriaceae bacterium]
MKSRTALISLAVCSALAITGFGLAEALAVPAISPAQDVMARRAFEAAMNVRQSATSANVPARTRRLSEAQVTAMGSHGSARLKHSFIGKSLGAELKAMKQAQNMNATGQFRSAGGSAEHFIYVKDEPVGSGHLMLEGSYIAHSTVFVTDQGGNLVRADRRSVIDFTAEMDKVASTCL